jgi:hypothetical protein
MSCLKEFYLSAYAAQMGKTLSVGKCNREKAAMEGL